MRQYVKCSKRLLFLMLLVVWMIFGTSIQSKAADKEVTVYGISSSSAEKISIPNDFLQKVDLGYGDATTVTYSVVTKEDEKSCVNVTENGVVSPQYTYWKNYSGYSMSVSEGEPYDYSTMNSGDETVVVRVCTKTYTKTYTVLVHVVDYEDVYVNNVLDEYIRENVVPGLSDMQLMEIIAKFPAKFDYSANYSSAYSMIIFGGGDCWASTDAVCMLSKKIGSYNGLPLKAWGRNGNNDPGAGSGHMNAMVEYNGKYYEIEAGYNLHKVNGFRLYYIRSRESLLYYHTKSDGITIVQYDGYDNTGVLTIPSYIDGKKVVGLDENALYGTDFSEVILPNTLTEIGDGAFSNCSKLTKIVIPASVTSLGKSVFSACNSLNSIEVDSGNTMYTTDGKCLYTKDKKTLVSCPNAKEVIIPDTVTNIMDYAFYYNPNISSINIPNSVTEMGEGAFKSCGSLYNITFANDSIKKIGNYCFSYDLKLHVIRFPKSLTTLGAFALSSSRYLQNIYFQGNAPVFGGDVNGAESDSVFDDIEANVYFPKGNTTYTDKIKSNHGGTIGWKEYDIVKLKDLSTANIVLSKKSYVYDDSICEPKTTVTLDGKQLKCDTDYSVSYSNNRNAGIATVMITGINEYSGTAFTTFTISKGKRIIYEYISDDLVSEGQTTELLVTYYIKNPTIIVEDSSILRRDPDGIFVALKAGSTRIRIYKQEDENYLETNVFVPVTVKHSEVVTVADNTVKKGKITVKCGYCNNLYQATVPTSFSVYYTNKDGSYSDYLYQRYDVGARVSVNTYTDDEVDLPDFQVVSSNPSIIKVEKNFIINFVKDGVATISIGPKYNMGIAKKYTINVGTEKPTTKEPATSKPTSTKYKITFNSNGGSAVKTITAVKNKTIKAPKAPTRKGYKFQKWIIKGTNKTYKFGKLTSNVNLIASWNKVTYSIKYMLNKGTNNKSNPTKYYITSKQIIFKNATRTGYVFAGWYTNSKFNSKIKTIQAKSVGNKTLYAKWSKVSVGKGKIKKISTPGSGKLNIYLIKISGAVKYDIQISNSSKFKRAKTVITNKLSVAVSKLKKGKRYYVRYRTYKLDSLKKKVYGQWSNVRYNTVK